MKNINLELVIRIVATLVMWIIILALITITSLVASLMGSILPAMLYWLPLFLAIFVSFLIWNEHSWHVIKTHILNNIQQEITDEMNIQFGGMNEAELIEALEKVEQAKAKFGIGKEKRKKQKNDDIDISQRIKALSDTDLLHMKAQIADGTLTDDDILDYLNEIELRDTQR